MPRSTCPTCKQVIEGDLAEVTRHVTTCLKKSGKKKAKTPKARPPVAANRHLPVMPLTFLLTRPVPSQNLYKANDWTVYMQEAKAWHRYLALPLRSLVGLQFEWSSWELTRVYESPQRPFDYANLVGGAKPIPDALIKLGIIVDDTIKHFHCEYTQKDIDDLSEQPDLREQGVVTILRLVDARL